MSIPAYHHSQPRLKTELLPLEMGESSPWADNSSYSSSPTTYTTSPYSEAQLLSFQQPRSSYGAPATVPSYGNERASGYAYSQVAPLQTEYNMEALAGPGRWDAPNTYESHAQWEHQQRYRHAAHSSPVYTY